MDQHRNVGCHCLHGTHGSTARCSPPAPCPGRRARTYLVPQARVCSCFEEQCHCPRVATQDGCVESRGPVLENTGGDVGTMHGNKPKGSETQMFAKNKPMNKKEVTRKRLGHQRYRVWFRQGAGRLVGYEGGDFKCFNKNESQIHFTRAIFPFESYPCQYIRGEMNTALASAWQNQPLISETEAQAVMETIWAFYLLSLMINGPKVRQLNGDFSHDWPFVCGCKWTVQISVEALSYL